MRCGPRGATAGSIDVFSNAFVILLRPKPMSKISRPTVMTEAANSSATMLKCPSASGTIPTAMMKIPGIMNRVDHLISADPPETKP